MGHSYLLLKSWKQNSFISSESVKERIQKRSMLIVYALPWNKCNDHWYKKKADQGHKSNHLAPYKGMQLDTQQEQTCLTRFKTGGQERNMNCQQ